MSIFLGDSEVSKIFVGDSEVSGVFVGDTKVRPVAPVEYEVTANTFLYMPLKTNYTDYGTGSTVDGNTWAGVDCTLSNGYLTLSQGGYINNNYYSPSASSVKTVSFWFKGNGHTGNNGWVGVMGYTSSVAGKLYINSYNWKIGYSNDGSFTPTGTPQREVSISNPTTQRHLFCGVADTDNSTHYIYVDGVLVNTVNNISTKFGSGGGRAFDTVWGGNYKIGISLSELIADKGMFTADFISKYYKSNKGNYGL